MAVHLSHTLHSSLNHNSVIFTSACPAPLSLSIDSELNPQETQREVPFFITTALWRRGIIWNKVSVHYKLPSLAVNHYWPEYYFWSVMQVPEIEPIICISMTNFPQPPLVFQTYMTLKKLSYQMKSKFFLLDDNIMNITHHTFFGSLTNFLWKLIQVTQIGCNFLPQFLCC